MESPNAGKKGIHIKIVTIKLIQSCQKQQKIHNAYHAKWKKHHIIIVLLKNFQILFINIWSMEIEIVCCNFHI